MSYIKLHTPKKRGDGHKLFKHTGDDQIYVADWSGSTPDRTDDGPLYVIAGGVVTMGMWSAGICYSVPVRSTRHETDYRVSMTQETFDALRTLRTMKLEAVPALIDAFHTYREMGGF